MRLIQSDKIGSQGATKFANKAKFIGVKEHVQLCYGPACKYAQKKQRFKFIRLFSTKLFLIISNVSNNLYQSKRCIR